MTKTFPLVVTLLVGAVFAAPGCWSEDGAAPDDGADGGSNADSEPPGPACGRLTTLCAGNEPCEGAPDCKSQVCREGTCREIVPSDGVQNGDETDVDCGGSASPACSDGKKCLVADDCASGVCSGGVCQVPTATDGVKNGDETDKDCGGSKAPKCKTGQGCGADGDCDNVRCDTTQKKCKGPGDDDGLKNGDETGIDCGGPTTPKKCPPDQGCVGDSDCANTRCNTAKKCDPPKATDGLKNGTESDVDCGGAAPTNAPRCKEGRVCAADGDCADPFCSFDNKCVTGRSCKGTVGTATSGIVTCGKRETGDPTHVHESCCRSLPLPSTPAVRLDKYEVTAGRFRQFLESITGSNVRQWVKNEIQANTPTGQRLAVDIPAAIRDLLPASANPGEPLNLVLQVGATVMDAREPSMVQGCFQDYAAPNGAGEYLNGAYGASTYYWPQATLAAHFGAGIKARRFTQQQYDEKSINCAPQWLYAAFCAWDGGRLPTAAEMNDAWGPTTYPWNSATYSFPTNPGGDPYQYEQTANYFNNNFYFYHFPGYGDARDLSGYIAAPGRFIRDKTARVSPGTTEAWMDLGANMMEVTRFNAEAGRGFCDFSAFGGADTRSASCPHPDAPADVNRRGVLRAANVPMSIWVGGSWEGHYRFNVTQEPFFEKRSYNFPGHTQYGKTGVRCAR